MKSRIKILLVDDDYEMRKVLRFFLERKGYEIDIAEDANEALTKIKADRYDLLLTDIMMPGINGLEMVRMLRDIAIAVDFIVITGNDSQLHRDLAQLLGARGYFVKPFEPEHLLSLIETTTKGTRPEVNS